MLKDCSTILSACQYFDSDHRAYLLVSGRAARRSRDERMKDDSSAKIDSGMDHLHLLAFVNPLVIQPSPSAPTHLNLAPPTSQATSRMTVPDPSSSSSTSAQAQIPSPPSLLSDDSTADQTNTAALLLPHLALFAPPILQILRDHYESFGVIAHWAPVKAFGRVIIVWQEVEGCELAKRNGDYLKLDVDLPQEHSTDDKARPESQNTGEGYFKPKSNKNKPYVYLFVGRKWIY